MAVPFKPEKIVAALPGVLTKSTAYFVRVGTGFDLYVTNEAGAVNAYKLNAQAPDATLDAIAALDATPGLLEQTGADAFVKRAIGVAAAGSIPTRADNDNRYATPAQLGAKIDSALIGQANGVASLDGAGKIPAAQIPLDGDLHYQGTWNAATNAPAIPAAAAGNRGFYYKVATAGATAIDGINDWGVGDWIVSNGATWDKIDNTESVTSVAGLVGPITATGLTAALDLATGALQGLMSAAQFTKLAGIAAGATVNATDAQLRDRATHTGTQAPATILFAATARILGRASAGGGIGEELTGAQVAAMLPAASGATAGTMSIADFNKLAGVAAGATANSTDAVLKARANHTGTQDISTILAAATARIFGRNSAGGGTGEELTGAQVTALLSTVVANGAQGVMTGTDKNKLDGIAVGAIGSTDVAGVRAANGTGAVTGALIASSSAIVALALANLTGGFNWTSGLNFSCAFTANGTIATPVNAVPGTTRTIRCSGNDATQRTISFAATFVGTLPSIADMTSTKTYELFIYCYSSTEFRVSAI